MSVKELTLVISNSEPIINSRKERRLRRSGIDHLRGAASQLPQPEKRQYGDRQADQERRGAMGNRTESQTAKMLHSRQNRMKYMALLVCLAVLVTAGIGAIFHLNAIAKTYQETVLTCTAEPQRGPEYADFLLHTHNDD